MHMYALTSFRCNPGYQAGPGTSSAARHSPNATSRRRKERHQYRSVNAPSILDQGSQTYLPEVPPVHKQERPVRLRVLRLELEAQKHVRILGEAEVECCHEEPDACITAREALGQIACSPAAGVEAR